MTIFELAAEVRNWGWTVDGRRIACNGFDVVWLRNTLRVRVELISGRAHLAFRNFERVVSLDEYATPRLAGCAVSRSIRELLRLSNEIS